MTDDDTRERKPPTIFGQKCKPIDVGDKVKTRYVKIGDFWLSVVVNVPLGSVLAIGADGGYGDGCSSMGGSSSSRTVCQKRKWTTPTPTEEFDWVLHDVTKIFVEESIGVYEDSSVTERTRITFTSIIQMADDTWVRHPQEDVRGHRSPRRSRVWTHT